jgi:hypothetical protein
VSALKSSVFPVIVFLGSVTALAAQNTSAANSGKRESIAVIPFMGKDSSVNEEFAKVMTDYLESDGPYRPVVADLTNLPPDVPPVTQAYVCPNPYFAKDMAYAISGEVTQDEDQSYHIRLYLWEMASFRLLCSDELVARTKDDCQTYIPGLLDWLFSWIKPPEASSAQSEIARDAAKQPDPEKWLYAGARAASSLRFYDRAASAPFVEKQVQHYYNLTLAAHAAVHILPYLSVQAEGIFTTDYAPFTYIDKQSSNDTVLRSAPFTSVSLMFPVMVKGTVKKEFAFASAFAGISINAPLGEMKNDRYGGGPSFSYKVPLGYTAGINLGMKAGPGNIFLDIRWSGDFSDTLGSKEELLYRRSMLSIGLGYEFGFFTKKPKAAAAPDSAAAPASGAAK